MLRRSLGAIFPGQGSQKTGMGLDFYQNSPSAKTLLDNASDKLDLDLANLLFEKNDLLDKSEYTQVAIVLNSLMAFLALDETCKDLDFPILLGHSLGEFSALAVAGALSFIDALKLVRLRGAFMQEACLGKDAGMLVLLGLNDDLTISICESLQKNDKQVWVANYNCDGQIVLAGKRQDLEEASALFKEKGAKRAMLLNMSVASHCPLLLPAAKKLSPFLGEFLHDDFKSVISNVNALAYKDATTAATLLEAQLVSPVLYKQSIKASEEKVLAFVEFGSKVLSGLNKKITSKPTYSLTNMQEIEDFARSLS